MHINISEISVDTIIQTISIIGATMAFLIQQTIEKRKDRTQANRESYQQLEFASIDLFRFEAENIDLIRPIWEDDTDIPDEKTAEYIVLMNYVCQMLNLFEMALKFRKDKTLLPEVFGTWIAWFQLLVCSPGFPHIWKDVRMDYLPELREILDGGLLIAQQETDDEIIEKRFYQYVSSLVKLDNKTDWTALKNKLKKNTLKDKTPKKTPAANTIDTTRLSFKWVDDANEAENLTNLFIDNSKENYISHSEIQEGRAYDNKTWADNISTILSSEFRQATKNKLFEQSNIIAAYFNNKIVAFALIEYENSPKGPYAILSDIIVDKNYRRNKIGENLVKWVLPQLSQNNIKSMFAESNINNDFAHKFLIDNGFKSISKVFKLDIKS